MGRNIKKIIFIWSSKNTMLIDELKKLESINKNLIELKIFITGDEIPLESQDDIKQGRPNLKQELISC